MTEKAIAIEIYDKIKSAEESDLLVVISYGFKKVRTFQLSEGLFKIELQRLLNYRTDAQSNESTLKNIFIAQGILKGK